MTGRHLAAQLVEMADALDELSGDDANHYPPALVVAAAKASGLLRTTAATVRDEHSDDDSGSSFAGSYTSEIVTLATDAYRDGHRDGWISCLAAHGEIPDDPDDPQTMADAGTVAPATFPPRHDDPAVNAFGPPAPPRDLRRLLTQTTPRPIRDNPQG